MSAQISVGHVPEGNNPRRCTRCKAPHIAHRVDHAFELAACRRCGVASDRHASDRRSKGHPFEGAMSFVRDREGDLVDACLKCGLPRSSHRAARTSRFDHCERLKAERVFVGVDGEGSGRFPHRYTMLCWRDETGKRFGVVQDPKGLSTEECLDFLLDLPHDAGRGAVPIAGDRSSDHVTTFGFSFRYDLAKILADLSNESLYLLMRPDLRRMPGKRGKLRPVTYRDFELDYYGGKFIISKSSDPEARKRSVASASWHPFEPGKLVPLSLSSPSSSSPSSSPPSSSSPSASPLASSPLASSPLAASRTPHPAARGPAGPRNVQLCARCSRPQDHADHHPKGRHDFEAGRTHKKTVVYDGVPIVTETELCKHCGRPRSDRLRHAAPAKKFKSRAIWDCFTFFQASFVSALTDWKITDPATLEQITKMKEARGTSQWMGAPEARDAALRYCLDECRLLATLMRQFVTSCRTADIDLAGRYHGAGSVGGAMLKELGIDRHVKNAAARWPKGLVEAVKFSYFGGRFEHSVLGPIDGPVFGFDISSAYPYHTFQLPCLECGHWKRTKKREDLEAPDVAAALVRYGLGDDVDPDEPWGPFPFRAKDGTITFPLRSGGGWVWRSEFLAGERAFRHVEFREAWIYTTKCTHRPFAKVPTWYRHRLRIGKEGAGIVLKLGVNSIYGQMARSVGGGGKYQCWIWASMITAGCRAMVLDALALHEDRRNLLAVATDGIYSREDLKMPAPIDTKTFDCERAEAEHRKDHVEGKACEHCGTVGCKLAHKPLGGWERTAFPNGMFLLQPGVYLPLNPDAKMSKKLRARGIGRVVLRDHWKQMLEAWADGKEMVNLKPTSEDDRGFERFLGAKTGVYVVPADAEDGNGKRTRSRAKRSRPEGNVQGPLPCPRAHEPRHDAPGLPCTTCHGRHLVYYVRSENYGEWTVREVAFALAATPKRRAFRRRVKNASGTYAELSCWSCDDEVESAPYARAMLSAEGRKLREHEDEMLDQPDGELALDLNEIAE